MTARQQWAYAFFKKEGYSAQGAAAIIGNLSGESGVNLDSKVERGPRADHGSGGIAEWRLDRKTNLKRFAERLGKDVNGLEIQCMFVIHELQNDYPALDEQLREGKRTIENLTANFCYIFERPNKQLARLDNRIAQAKKILREAGIKSAASEAVIAGGVAGMGAGAAAGATTGMDMTSAIITAGGALLSIIGLWINRKRPADPVQSQIAPEPAPSLIEELKALVEARKRTDARIEEIVAAVKSQAAEVRSLTADLPGSAVIDHRPALGD